MDGPLRARVATSGAAGHAGSERARRMISGALQCGLSYVGNQANEEAVSGEYIPTPPDALRMSRAERIRPYCS